MAHLEKTSRHARGVACLYVSSTCPKDTKEKGTPFDTELHAGGNNISSAWARVVGARFATAAIANRKTVCHGVPATSVGHITASPLEPLPYETPHSCTPHQTPNHSATHPSAPHATGVASAAILIVPTALSFLKLSNTRAKYLPIT